MKFPRERDSSSSSESVSSSFSGRGLQSESTLSSCEISTLNLGRSNEAPIPPLAMPTAVFTPSRI